MLLTLLHRNLDAKSIQNPRRSFYCAPAVTTSTRRSRDKPCTSRAYSTNRVRSRPSSAEVHRPRTSTPGGTHFSSRQSWSTNPLELSGNPIAFLSGGFVSLFKPGPGSDAASEPPALLIVELRPLCYCFSRTKMCMMGSSSSHESVVPLPS